MNRHDRWVRNEPQHLAAGGDTLGFLRHPTPIPGFLDALPRHVPAGVLLDVQMPGLDGWELQSELATSGWRVPVIFITAHEDAAAQERVMSTGAVTFLRKPFTDQQLLEAIDTAVRRGPADGRTA